MRYEYIAYCVYDQCFPTNDYVDIPAIIHISRMILGVPVLSKDIFFAIKD